MKAENESAERGAGWPLRRLVRGLRDEPRPLPAARALRTTLRTAHVVVAAALYGGHVYGLPAERLVPALVATVATGAALLGLEVYRTPVWLFQVRGVATIAKVALATSVAVFWELRVVLLTLAMAIGVVNSHMPGRWRYHSLVHGRVFGPEEKG